MNEETIKTTERCYTIDELAQELSNFRGERLPLSTHRYRVKSLNLIPNIRGFYEQSDLDLLIKLDMFLKQPGTSIKLFIRVMESQSCQ